MINQEKILKELSIESQIELKDFINFLLEKEKKRIKHKKRLYGLCKGEIKISDDFSSPIDEALLKEWGML